MVKRVVALIFLFVFGSVGLMACGGADVGEACDTAGATDDECTENAVCGDSGDGTGALKCLKVCTDQSQCAADEECNGVSGSSIKGCRLKAK